MTTRLRQKPVKSPHWWCSARGSRVPVHRTVVSRSGQAVQGHPFCAKMGEILWKKTLMVDLRCRDKCYLLPSIVAINLFRVGSQLLLCKIKNSLPKFLLLRCQSKDCLIDRVVLRRILSRCKNAGLLPAGDTCWREKLWNSYGHCLSAAAPKG